MALFSSRSASTAFALLAVQSLVALTACSGNNSADTGTDAGSIDAVDVVHPPDSDSSTDATDAPIDTTTVPAPWLLPYTPSPRSSFPPGFLWGSATAPYQIEGMLHNTDWYQWEQMHRVVNDDHADDGPQSLQNYSDDIRTLVEMHQNSYRFGIDMSRLFPTAQQWATCRSDASMCQSAADPVGLAYYHSILSELATNHIAAMVTLQHFVLPSYLDDLSMDFHSQGWLRAGIDDDLAAFAGFAATEYGAQVDWWITLNEPTAYAVVAFLNGAHPPGQTLAIDALKSAVVAMIHSHVKMYDVIHLHDTVSAIAGGPPARVSIAHHARRMYPANPGSARDIASAQRTDQLYNHTFFDAIVNGTLDTNLNGVQDPGEPTNDPSLAHRADFLGVNYYGLTVVATNPAIPLLGALPQADSIQRGLPKTDYGWDIHPHGMYDELMWATGYHLANGDPIPIVVTENGIADVADVNRARFIAEHLATVGAAIHDGANIIGYFHWSNIDNFEWSGGYCPHFGLYSVDRTSAARTRTARPSAMIYQQIIAAGEVTDALLNAQPAYQSATTFCLDHPASM